MGVDEGNVVATEAVDFDVVGRDDDDDDDDDENACGNQSFCQLLLSNNGEVVELEHSFRFSPPLFQHSVSASSSYSSSCCSTSSSSGLLCFGATAEGEEALLFRGRTDNDSGTRKATPASAPSKRKRDDRVQKKPNPSNKGRKEKLGERVAALQQLVSPFGKTDTASVLHEAMGYIKFLQEQVQVLCTPYLQHHPPHPQPQPQPQPRPPDDEDPGEAEEGAREGGGGGDLRSRGLCLVPVACCVHMQGSCIGADFWSPSTWR